MGRGRRGALGHGRTGIYGANRQQHPMFREACLPEHWVNVIFSGDPGPDAFAISQPAARSERKVTQLVQNQEVQ